MIQEQKQITVTSTMVIFSCFACTMSSPNIDDFSKNQLKKYGQYVCKKCSGTVEKINSQNRLLGLRRLPTNKSVIRLRKEQEDIVFTDAIRPKELACHICSREFSTLEAFSKNQWKKHGRLACHFCTGTMQEMFQNHREVADSSLPLKGNERMKRINRKECEVLEAYIQKAREAAI